MSIRRSSIGYVDFSGGDANFIIGCTPASAGCANCYARELIEKRQGRDFSEIRLYPEKLWRLGQAKFEEKGTPFRRGPGSRPIVFPVDLGDIMHPDVPSSFISDALNVMVGHDDADWLILTKRASRLLEFYPDGWPENIWPGVTVEKSDFLWRIDYLLQVKSTVRWVSIEPMLGPVEIFLDLIPIQRTIARLPDWVHLDWVIVGGESGRKRRPFNQDWARDIRDQCKSANIPFFYKQGSHRFPGRNDVLDGQQWKQFPRSW